MFIVSHGPDQECIQDEASAFDVAFDWSVELGGDIVLIEQSVNGKVLPFAEVFA